MEGKRPIRYLLEYLGVQALRVLFLPLPWRMALALGRALGRVIGFCLQKRSMILAKNLRMAFPEKEEEELRILARACWAQVGQTAAEFIKIPQITAANLSRYVDFRGAHHIESALNKGQGVIFMTCHTGNWEMSGMAACHLGFPLAAVAKTLKNPWVDRLVNQIRESSGEQVIPHTQAVKEGLRWLKDNRCLAILIDQNMYKGGVFVKFFGRPAATTSLVSVLARRTGATILPIFSWREGRKLVVDVQPPFGLPPSPPEGSPERGDTQALTHCLEGWIRARPSDWLWIHNRWKRQPNDSGKVQNVVSYE